MDGDAREWSGSAAPPMLQRLQFVQRVVHLASDVRFVPDHEFDSGLSRQVAGLGHDVRSGILVLLVGEEVEGFKFLDHGAVAASPPRLRLLSPEIVFDQPTFVDDEPAGAPEALGHARRECALNGTNGLERGADLAVKPLPITFRLVMQDNIGGVEAMCDAWSSRAVSRKAGYRIR